MAIKTRIGIISVLMVIAAGLVYYYWFYRPHHPQILETAYVMSPSLDVLDTYAPVHSVLDVLKAGEPAQIIRRGEKWDKILLANGKTGWVLSGQLIGPKVYSAGKALLDRVSHEQVQAVGHASDVVNMHVEPSREGALLSVLSPGEKVDFFDREMVARNSPSEGAAGAGATQNHPMDAWYLVRTESDPPRAGWALGRLITLDIPSAISQYAQAYNLVAWRPFAYVEDNGQRIPEYVVADRVGTGDVDFNHIRVFTWWAARGHYVTSFVESGLSGAFPITVGKEGNTPYFCLKLKDKQGEKFQKFYGLYDTVVRPIGTVAGWEANAAPPPELARSSLRKRARGR